MESARNESPLDRLTQLLFETNFVDSKYKILVIIINWTFIAFDDFTLNPQMTVK